MCTYDILEDAPEEGAGARRYQASLNSEADPVLREMDDNAQNKCHETGIIQWLTHDSMIGGNEPTPCEDPAIQEWVTGVVDGMPRSAMITLPFMEWRPTIVITRPGLKWGAGGLVWW